MADSAVSRSLIELVEPRGSMTREKDGYQLIGVVWKVAEEETSDAAAAPTAPVAEPTPRLAPISS